MTSSNKHVVGSHRLHSATRYDSLLSECLSCFQVNPSQMLHTVTSSTTKYSMSLTAIGKRRSILLYNILVPMWAMLHLCYHEHLSMVRCLIRHSLPILEYEVPTDVSLTGACLRSTYETINEYHNAPVALHIIKYLKHRYYTEAVSHIYRSRFANSNAIAIRRLCILPLYINRVSRSVQDSATSDPGEAINVCV